MFEEAELSVAVIEKEGAYGRLLALGDIITLSITDALDLLIYTDRIRATLRS